MNIEQVLYKDIPREIYRKVFNFSFPGGAKEIYFKLEKDLAGKELWEIVDQVKDYPRGMMVMEAVGQYNYIKVVYYPKEITEQKISEFVKAKVKVKV